MNLLQVIGAHDPDEVNTRKTAFELGQGVGRAPRTKQRLHGAGADAWVPRDMPGAGEALVQRGHLLRILEGILRTNQQPDFVQPEPPQRFPRHMGMPLVRRIEGAAEQTDPRAAWRQAAPQSAPQRGAGWPRGKARTALQHC